MNNTDYSHKEMPFISHLADLRTCIVRSLMAVAGASALTLFFAGDIFLFLSQPLNALGSQVQLIGTSPAEAFMVKLKVGIYSGVLLGSPLVFYQLWLFISPGLKSQEKRWALPFVICTTSLFLVGISFCFFLVLPLAFDFFVKEYQSITVSPTIRISDYLEFVITMTLVFGVVFELPVLAFILARLNLLTHTFLIRHFRVSVVIIFVVAAILTPPDIISQTCLALPLLVIYLLCIGLSYKPTQNDTLLINQGSNE